MAMASHGQVLDGLDQLGGRSMKATRGEYRDGIVSPIVDAIRGAESLGEMAQRMSGVFMKQDAALVEERLTDLLTQSALIGVVSARPTRSAGPTRTASNG